jgi:hypothetical protein
MLGIVAKADQLEWVKQLETGGVKDPDSCLHTSHGLIIARGAYGLSKDAWNEVSNNPWTDAHNEWIARRAAAAYLEITYIRLKAKLQRELTFADVYAGYRFGVSGYVKMGGRIWFTPANFQKKLQEYHVPYQRLTK